MYFTTYDFEKRWIGCRACTLCESRRSVVTSRIGRNSLDPGPRTIYIGESPGKTEDVTGLPFIGNSGRILDIMLREARPHQYLITNLVSCKTPNRPPTSQEIEECSGKLHELIDEYKPDCAVFIGNAKTKLRIPTHKMMNIASIVRMEYPLHSFKEQILLLSRFLDVVFNSKKK